MLSTLRRKLTVLAACLTGSVVVVVCLVSFLLIRNQYLQSRALAFELAAASVSSQWQLEGVPSAAWLQASMETGQFQIALWENHIPLGYNLSDPEQLETLLQARPDDLPGSDTLAFSVGSYRCIWRELSFAYGNRQFLIWQDTTPENTYLLRLGGTFGVIAGLSLCAVAALCYLVAGRAIEPAQEAMERQDHFVAAASHELRSPLTVLRTGFGVIEKDPSQREYYLSLMARETDRMRRLVDDLLLLAGGGKLRKTFTPTAIEPDTLLIEFADSIMPVAQKAGIRIDVRLPEGRVPVVKADEHMLRQLLMILVDNALRFSPKGSAIVLALQCQERHWVVLVADHGPGIADGEKAKIFDRFYRGSQSRTDPTHFGLGLSVAQELLAIHNGKIQVKDTPGGGATFRVELPY